CRASSMPGGGPSEHLSGTNPGDTRRPGRGASMTGRRWASASGMVEGPLRTATARYGFAFAMVMLAFVLRLVLEPLTGTGAPFVLFFGAMLLSGLIAGVGPAILAVGLSLPLGGYVFAVRAGYSPSQTLFQCLLFSIDGVLLV